MSMNDTYQGQDTYISQDHHSFVKENFRMLGNFIEEKVRLGQLPKNAHVLDIGCATGALIAYLSARFPKFCFRGLDPAEELLVIAKEKLPNIDFDTGSAERLCEIYQEKFDLLLCFGVIGILDDISAKTVFEQMISICKSPGCIYVFSQFNEFDIDVMVKHRNSKEAHFGAEWAVGWNIYSIKTIELWLENKVKGIKFINFDMPLRLPMQPNPVRSWTIDVGGGKLQLTNGLKLLIDLKFCEIKV